MTHRPTFKCQIEVLEDRRLLSVGSPYLVPLNPQTSINLNPGWKFALYTSGSSPSLASPTFNASAWTNVTLPHTWDANSTNVQIGDGWYRQTVTIPASMSGNEIYLQFQGASLSATVYVDGIAVGSHNGGWEAFDVDATAQLTTGSHLVAVDVNNKTNSNVVPAGGGDYTKQGGLYRSVSLLAVSNTHVALTEPVIAPDTSGSLVAGSGVYFSNSAVSMGIASADIQVQTVLHNVSASAVPLTVTSYLVDAGGIIRAQQSSSVMLTAGQKDAGLFQNATVFSPHLWDGLADPYLYDLYVQVSNTTTGQLLDLNHQQVGIRSIRIDSNTGFYLNGMPYKLVGVNMHQDSGVAGQNGGIAGWAQTDTQQDNDLDIALAMGVTMIRTSHYQRDAAFYSYCDQKGLIIETETGINNTITSTTMGSPFFNNAQDALTEMIRQNYDHPSIVFWSMFNEIGSNTNNAAFIATLSTLAHALDQTGRDTIVETNSGGPTDGINNSTDAANYHPYNGWYGGNPAGIAGNLASTHAASSIPIGVGEFGAGASAYQFTTNITIPIASTTAVYHPENEQTTVLEAQYAAISSQPYLLDIIDWVMFDFSSSGRNEGDTAGINDKGLVTRDRTTYKDAYYFYQANWNNPTSSRGYNTTPVVWVSDHAWTDRQGLATVPITAFSNIGAPTLTLNGGAPVVLVPQVVDGLTIPDTYTTNINLAAGSNAVQISGRFNGKTYTNSVAWTYHAAALSGTPYAKVQFTNSTSNLQSGYAADTGQAFSAQSSGATYGWTDLNGNPLANISGTYDRTGNTAAPYNVSSAQTGIILNPANQWQYQLPNGTYDVEIVGADSSTSNIVDNVSVNGTLLHATSFSTSGGTYQAFYDTVTVTNGKLIVTGGQGMVLSNGGVPTTQGRLSSIMMDALSGPAATAPVTTLNAAPSGFGFQSQAQIAFAFPQQASIETMLAEQDVLDKQERIAGVGEL